MLNRNTGHARRDDQVSPRRSRPHGQHSTGSAREDTREDNSADEAARLHLGQPRTLADTSLPYLASDESSDHHSRYDAAPTTRSTYGSNGPQSQHVTYTDRPYFAEHPSLQATVSLDGMGSNFISPSHPVDLTNFAGSWTEDPPNGGYPMPAYGCNGHFPRSGYAQSASVSDILGPPPGHVGRSPNAPRIGVGSSRPYRPPPPYRPQVQPERPINSQYHEARPYDAHRNQAQHHQYSEEYERVTEPQRQRRERRRRDQ